MFKKSEFKISEDKNFYKKFLNKNDQKILNDYKDKNVEKLFFYDERNKSQYTYVILKRRVKKFIPLLEFLYISDKKKFKEDYLNIKFYLLKKYKIFIFGYNHFDDNDSLLISKKLFSLSKKQEIYYFNKPDKFVFDLLYSELIV